MSLNRAAFFKIGLIVVLAMVFLLVIGRTIHTMSSGPSKAPTSPTKANEPSTESPAVAGTTAETSDAVWPRFTLADIIAYDPFAVLGSDAYLVGGSKNPGPHEGNHDRGSSAEAEFDTTSDAKSAGHAGRITVVYQRGNHSAAIIDSRTVRPGDNIEGAGRVIDVDQNGVTVRVEK